MPKFVVQAIETVYSEAIVDADTEEEALEKAWSAEWKETDRDDYEAQIIEVIN